MARSSQPQQSKRRFSWRAFVAGIFIVIGLAAFVGYSMVHWVEKQVLTTDNWVATVSSIPKDDTVATTLSNYSVNQLFTSTDLENRIAEALPDRAVFLAPALSDQLQTRLTNRTKQVIQSDKFQSVWETINREASQRILTKAREAEPQQQPRTAQVGRFSLDLSSLKDTVTKLLNERSGQTVASLQPSDSKQRLGIAVNLRTSVQNLHRYIRLVDFLNATLWILGLVCVLAAIIVARTYRKVLLLVSGSMVVLSLLQIAGVKALRPVVLNYVGDASYRPAVGVVYDQLLATFRTMCIGILIGSLVLFVLALVLHKPLLERSETIKGWMKKVKASTVWQRGAKARKLIGTYRYYIMGGLAVLGLAIVAFAIDITWTSGVQSVLGIVLVLECVSLISLQGGGESQGAPMKQ